MMIFNYFILCLGIFIIYWTFFSKKKNSNNALINKLYSYINKYYNYLVFILLFIIVFTSIYNLGKTPMGLHVDEAGMAYDAISLSKYGVDRYLNKFPVYLINFGGGQSAMYAYLVSVLIKIFGYSNYIIRIPSVIFRILLSLSIFSIIRDDKNKFKNLLLLFLLAICPYFIMQSRFGLDCNLLVGFLTISICILYKAIKNRKNIMFFFSGVLFGFSLYTYALSYLIIPIFLLIILLYLLYIKKINFSNIIIMGIPLFVLALPLILMILVNNNVINEIRTFITIPKIPFYRGSEISLSNIPDNLYILSSILSYDNPNIFGNNLIYNATREFGTFYYFTIPFILIGLFISLKRCFTSIEKKEFNHSIIFTLLFFTVLVIQLLIYQPNINKANAIFISLLYFALTGIYEIIKNKKVTFIPIFIILFINFLQFFNYYFYNYNDKTINQQYFATYYLDALEFARSLGKNNIYVDDYITEQQNIYILLNSNVSPYEYDYNKSLYSEYTFIKTINNRQEIIYQNILNDIEFSNDNVYIVKNGDIYLINMLEDNDYSKKVFNDISVLY